MVCAGTTLMIFLLVSTAEAVQMTTISTHIAIASGASVSFHSGKVNVACFTPSTIGETTVSPKICPRIPPRNATTKPYKA